MAESRHGRFVWYEMLTVDRDATIDFYKRIVRCMDPQGAAFALHSKAGGAG